MDGGRKPQRFRNLLHMQDSTIKHKPMKAMTSKRFGNAFEPFPDDVLVHQACPGNK
jgi:hypothetical protein